MLRGDSVLCDNVDNRAPTGDTIAVECREETLRECFEQLVRAQVGLVEGFTRTIQRFLAGAGNREIFTFRHTPEQVHRGQHRLVVFVESGDYGLAEVRPETLLVQCG